LFILDLMEVNENKQHQFQKPHYSTNEDENAVVLKTENFTQKQAGKSGVKGSFTCSECGKRFRYKSFLKPVLSVERDSDINHF